MNNTVNNQIEYEKYYEEYLAKHPGYAKRALGFMPISHEDIKIYLEGGDYVIWNFIYNQTNYVENEVPQSTKRKVGRPKKSNTKVKRLNIRLSGEEYDRLLEVTRRTRKTASDIFREAINAAYEEVTRNDYDPADFYDEPFYDEDVF